MKMILVHGWGHCIKQFFSSWCDFDTKKRHGLFFSIISGFHEICDEKERSGQRKWKRNGFSSDRNYKRTNGNIYGVKLSTVLSLKKSCLSVLFVFYPKHFLPSSEREKHAKNWTTSWPFSASEWLQGIVLVYSRCVMQIYFGSSWKLISYSSTGFDGVMLFAYFRQKIVVFFEGIWSSSITFCHNSFFSFFLQKLKSSLVSNLVRRSRDVIGKWGVESGLGKNTKM